MRICETCGARFRGNPERCPLDGGKLVPLPDPLIGRTLAGRYVIEEKIGVGGMGTVYRAKHEVVGRDVAVKFLAPELSFEPTNRTRFLREARAANRINHEHIIDITDFGETDDGHVYLVMEFLDGIPLSKAIEEGALEMTRALRIMRQIAKALGRAHELDVVHRDVKPDNIFLLRGYEGDFVKLLDFGLAQMKGELRVTATGTVFGTPEYIAPEQARGAPLGPPADLYSCGCVFFEMLTGVLPFTGSTPDLILKHLREPARAPSFHVPTLPPEVDAIALRLLEKRPDDRFATAHELVAALDQVLGVRTSVTEVRPAVAAQPAPHPGASDLVARWHDRVEVFRHLIPRAHPQGDAPPWLADAIEALGAQVTALRKLLEDLSERISRAAVQEDETRGVRLRIGHALDSLAAEIARVQRERAELDARLAEARARYGQVEAPLRAAWERTPAANAGVALDDATTALAEVGALARIRIEARARIADLDQDFRRLDAEGDDLSFQMAQLKGRLASMSAGSEVDLGELRDESSALDHRVQAELDSLARRADPVIRHFMAFPHLREVVRGTHDDVR
ncbi:MAG: protein kinase [Sandaracinus sp.]|nr:protein kinase [Sandaracinus sp.]